MHHLHALQRKHYSSVPLFLKSSVSKNLFRIDNQIKQMNKFKTFLEPKLVNKNFSDDNDVKKKVQVSPRVPKKYNIFKEIEMYLCERLYLDGRSIYTYQKVNCYELREQNR